MRTKIIIKKKSNDFITIFDSGKWVLAGRFGIKINGQVNYIDLILLNDIGLYKIKDVFFCTKLPHPRLEIHIFEGDNRASRFTANKTHLKQMTLNKGDEISFDFIDYSEDKDPEVKHCFVKTSIKSGLTPEVKEGNILVGA